MRFLKRSRTGQCLSGAEGQLSRSRGPAGGAGSGECTHDGRAASRLDRRIVLQPVAKEALLAAAVATLISAALVWLGPPGTDLAAHLYQRTLFLEHGFAVWNNFWYAGRYSFITYSVLYYPLAAVLGIGLLAVASVATAAGAFAVLAAREWGAAARSSSRTFALVWGCYVLSGAFPFVLGVALALLALCALQAGRRLLFVGLATLTVAASPVAFLLFCMVLAAIALERRQHDARVLQLAAAVASIGLAETLLWRAFPAGGSYPFPAANAAAACVFCVIGFALTWRIERARLLHHLFLIYLTACIALFLFPFSIGENVARLRFVAVPIAVLALSLRSWRPRPVALLALTLAISWNLSPLAASAAQGVDNPAASASYWRPAIVYLKAHLSPSYRVEAVDTAGHWPAVYLARAGIPLTRGWFRQNDFPQNKLLYAPDHFGRAAYVRWLRSLGVRYVVASRAPPDYSARAESRLVRNDESSLRIVLRNRNLDIFEVRSPRPIIVGPDDPEVLKLGASSLVLHLNRAGDYRIALRYSPYWTPSEGCVSPSPDGMVRLHAPRPGLVTLRFVVTTERALATVAGVATPVCAD